MRRSHLQESLAAGTGAVWGDTGLAMDFHPVERNLREMFRSVSAIRPSACLYESNGVWIACLGVAFQMFNTVFLCEPVESEAEFRQRIAIGARFMAARGLPWSLWLCEDWLAPSLRRKAVKICEQNGLRLASEMPGMVTERMKPPIRPLPSFELVRVSSENHRQHFCGIGSTCFRVPRGWFEEVFDHAMTRRPDFEAYIGYLLGEPIATAATVTANGVIGVYNVAVLPGHQQQGYGEAVMRHAVHVASERTGLDRVILQSTRQALRLYERIGFFSVTRILVFTS
jgi:ribosomal protein S18 acetylase RimI-like enzyme